MGNDVIAGLYDDLLKCKDALGAAKGCLEYIKANVNAGYDPDWFDLMYVDQELERIKRTLEEVQG